MKNDKGRSNMDKTGNFFYDTKNTVSYIKTLFNYKSKNKNIHKLLIYVIIFRDPWLDTIDN